MSLMSARKGSGIESNTGGIFDSLISAIDERIGSKPLDVYYDDPVGFAKNIVKCDPTKDQVNILETLRDRGHVSVRSGHGIGKSTAMSLAALWFICTRHHAKIPVTAPTSHQLFDILWSELIKWWRGMDETYRNQFEHTSEKFFHKNHRESLGYISPDRQGRKT